MQTIQIHNASEHNLKHVSVTIPRDKLVVFTGVSGSGKSSLAFDTIYAEAQRNYLDSIGRYASQYLKPMEKPAVESVSGLSPAIAIDQKSVSRSPRSTVGTVTEITDHLRVLFARIGEPHCPKCARPIAPQSVETILSRIVQLGDGAKLQLLAPVVRGRKGDYNALFAQLQKEGFTRVQVDGETLVLEELPGDYRLSRNQTHTISPIIDRVVLRLNEEGQPDETIQMRLLQGLERALKKSGGFVIVENLSKNPAQAQWYSSLLSCPEHDVGVAEMAPRLFSFNSPYGACEACEGLGIGFEIDPDKLVPDAALSVLDGAIAPLHKLLGRSAKSYLKPVCRQLKIPYGKPFSELSESQKEKLFWGVGYQRDAFDASLDDTIDDDEGGEVYAAFWSSMAEQFDGIVPLLKRRYVHGTSAHRDYIGQFMSERICEVCNGARLKKLSLSVTLGDRHIHDLSELTLQEASVFFEALPAHLSDYQLSIGRQALQEIQHRLTFLLDVGLGYLTLSRRMNTLSGGESQRIRLASQIGSGLSGVLYVLDEPSIGLHPANNEKLIHTLTRIRDLGNSVLVVEHDESTIRAADFLVDIGPGAGKLGGEILASGTLACITKEKRSPTGAFLRGDARLLPPDVTRLKDKGEIVIRDAQCHNLKQITATFPLGVLTAVTGMSGSGKSTLVFDLLRNILKTHFGKFRSGVEGYRDISGLEMIDKVIEIDQSPIGRTPRSNPATYTGLFDHIRRIFSNSVEARMNGFTPGHFSFNVPKGRCEACKGDGYIKLAMSFLPDVYTPCETCYGQRYMPEVLRARVNGASIADVLNMSVDDALQFFEGYDSLTKMLSVLSETGLGYITLGQPATTLSGGEAQRLKLATEFCKRSTGKTVYLMDEPTIGLHWQDLEKLLGLLNRLVEAGNTVIVIEHDIDFIKMCDHVIDLGPGGGPDGGEIIAAGTPQQVAEVAASLTGQFLAKSL